MPVLDNQRWEAFARSIAKGMSGREAYRAAGYRASDRAADANASKLLASANVAARVEELKQAAAKRASITASRVLEELGRIAFGKISDEDPYDFTTLSKDQIASMSVKRAALTDLGRYFNMFADRIQHSGRLATEISGPGGGPVLMADVTDSDRAKALTALMAKIKAKREAA